MTYLLKKFSDLGLYRCLSHLPDYVDVPLCEHREKLSIHLFERLIRLVLGVQGLEFG